MEETDSCPRISHVPSYDEFFETYLKPNHPVIIGPALIQSWPAYEHWTITGRYEVGGSVDWGYLLDRYGRHEVTVADCSLVDSFGNQERDTRSFRDIVALWLNGEGESLYVKDWHLAKTIETEDPGKAFYTTPDIFCDDWMNAYYAAHTNDDFRFVYVGVKGTFTPLHRDVYTSYSWSTNICGLKRWWLFPPDQTPFLFMRGRNMVPYDARNADPAKFPEMYQTHPIVIDQSDGETVFVPSGWYHQVENLTPCISINHNWCNSVNLLSLYKSMCDKVTEVEQALEDVKEILSAGSSDDTWKVEWTSIVQDVVKHDAGWNWLTFWRMALHALRAASPYVGENTLATQSEHCPQASLFRPAPSSLRPPAPFIRERVRECYDDFVRRNRSECEGDVGSVIASVCDVLHRWQ